MSEVTTAVIVLISVFIGFKFGKGEPIIETPKILKRIIRSEADEAKLIEKLQREGRKK